MALFLQIVRTMVAWWNADVGRPQSSTDPRYWWDMPTYHPCAECE
jgi:hypothetical protein